MEENMDKNDMLKAVVLLLLGFVVGFATHAFISVTGTDDVNLMLDEEESSIVIDDETIPEINNDDEEDKNEETPVSVTDEKEEDVLVPIVPPVAKVINTSYNVSITNQPAGELVYISEMSLKDNAWIAIREDVNGVPTNILGAGWFPTEVSSGVVELLRPTVADATYHAVIFVDDGDKKFDHKVDSLVDGVSVKFLTY